MLVPSFIFMWPTEFFGEVKIAIMLVSGRPSDWGRPRVWQGVRRGGFWPSLLAILKAFAYVTPQNYFTEALEFQ